MQTSLVSSDALTLESTCFLYCCAFPPSPLPQTIPGSYLCVLSSLRGLKGQVNGVEKGEKRIVCYQQDGVDLAAQVWWLLQAIGYTDVQVLDGGLRAYQSLQLPLSPLLVSPDPSPLPEVSINPALYKLEPEIKKTLQSRTPHQLIDTDGSYLGAVHCPARLFLTEAGSLSDPDSIHLLLSGLGIRVKTATIVVGKSAAVVLLALSSFQSVRYLCLGILESRATGPFLTAPEPTEPRSFRTEFYSISGNTEYFDAQAEESVRRSIKLPQMIWAPPKKPVEAQEQSKPREEKKEQETQRSCSLCRLL